MNRIMPSSDLAQRIKEKIIRTVASCISEEHLCACIKLIRNYVNNYSHTTEDYNDMMTALDNKTVWLSY